MMRITIIFLLLMVQLFCVSAYENENSNEIYGEVGPMNDTNSVIDDVTKLVRDFSSLAGASFDKVEKLKALVEKENLQFLSLLGPVGAVFSTTLSVAVKTNSSEYLAVKQLEAGMNWQFEQTMNAVDNVVSKLSEFIILNDYSSEVSLRLTNLRMGAKFAFNQEISHEKRKDEFLDICSQTPANPFFGLNWLYQNVDLNCLLPTKQEAKNYALIMNVMNQIEFDQQFQTWEKSDFNKKKKKIFGRYKKSNNETVRSVVQQLEQALGKDRSEMYDVFDLILKDGFEGTQLSCLPDLVNEANQYEREPLFYLADLVRLDLIELEFFAKLCTHARYNNDSKAIDEKTQYIKDVSTSMLNKLSTFIQKKIDLGWEGPLDTKVKQIVGFKAISADQYNSTAEKVRVACNKLGPQSFQHSIIVAPSWSYPKYWRSETLGFRCAVVTDIADVNVFITRHESNATDRLINGQKWLDTQRPFIEIALKQLYWKESLIYVANELRKELGDLDRPDGFATVVLVRNIKLFDSACVINYGITMNEYVGGQQTHELVSFHANPPLEDSVRIYLFFML